MDAYNIGDFIKFRVTTVEWADTAVAQICGRSTIMVDPFKKIERPAWFVKDRTCSRCILPEQVIEKIDIEEFCRSHQLIQYYEPLTGSMRTAIHVTGQPPLPF